MNYKNVPFIFYIKIITVYKSAIFLKKINVLMFVSVIPASPINITVVDKTQSSAMLRWSVGTMTAFPRELIHKIEYKSQWDSNPEHWHVSVHAFSNKNNNYTM